jgi:hypothetical protein
MPQKLWIPLHVPSPPFTVRRSDFYIPKMPLNLRNIPSVNMYMNVFYIPWFAGLISYIYKSATSSHAKPGLFEVASLTWLSSDSPILHPYLLNFGGLDTQFRKFLIPELRRFKIPDLHRLMVPDLRRFMTPYLLLRFPNPSPITPEFRGSGHTISQVPWFQSFAGSRFQIFAGSITLQRSVDSREIAIFSCYFRILFENLFHEIQQTRRFEGDRVLPSSPTKKIYIYIP